MAKNMKKMRVQLEKIAKQNKDFNLMPESSSTVQVLYDDRATSPNVEESVIVGRAQDKQRILFYLSDKILTQDFIILAIYGMGGIGKTTLVQLVFSDTKFREYSLVWVYVSQVFDLNKIESSIISQLPKMDLSMSDSEVAPTNRNILIVLDDLWENNGFKLDKLKLKLKVRTGAKVIVIVTTRDEDIARRFSNVEPYKLEPLTDGICWNIIKQKSAFEDRGDKERLEQTGREIARKCGSVALAAQSLGYLLHSKRLDEWESVKDNDIWNESTLEDASSPHHVLASLKLSYVKMQPSLKLCFGYCAIFPKGQKIVKDDLIHQWISLNFIKPSKTAGDYHDNFILLTMHDLVHDLARSVMFDEIQNDGLQGDTSGRNCRYALRTEFSKPLETLRALRFMGCSIDNRLHNDSFSSAKYLRLLDLSECSIQRLPDSIGQLKQLRYLNATGVQHETIPDGITKLLKLMYLSLRGSSGIQALPEFMGEMEDLMYLDLSDCSRIIRLPVSFGKLTKLVHLDLSHCTRVRGVSESLESLTNVEYLNLSNCKNIGELPGALGFKKLEKLPTSFGNLNSLMHFDLSHCLQVKGIPEALGGLTNLQVLNLSHCYNIFENDVYIRRKVEAIGNLKKLQYLNLSDLLNKKCHDKSTYVSFFECINTLSNLEHLDLSHNEYLRSLPDCFGSLKRLHTLDVSGCSFLDKIPPSIHNIDNLKFLHADTRIYLGKSMFCLLNESSVSLPHFVVQANANGSGSNLVLLQDVNPPKLEISSLENVRSINEVQIIKLLEKQRIEELKLEWAKDAVRFVEDIELLGEIIPPTNLMEFEIHGYNCTKFPAWLMGIAPYLPNLVRLTMMDMPCCISLPPLGQLPNLKELTLEKMKSVTKIDGDFCGGRRPFPRLKKFVMRDMESLQVWNTIYCSGVDGVSEFMFPILPELSIFRCTKLRLTPCPLRAEKWNIWGSDGVISSWEESAADIIASCSSPLVTTLSINCKVSLHEWRLLHHLPDLKGLIINDCNDWTISAEIIRALSSLESLTLERWYNQAQLPNWLGQLVSLKELKINRFEMNESQEDIKHLMSLQKLCLHRCTSMTKLPKWVGDLVSLQKLEILSCPDLKYLPESMGCLTSLKKLNISFCDDIESLPEGIEKLCKLEYISMSGCPKLVPIR
uniref:Leucine Rich Repeat family protein, expressed n=1 Tax=Oryza sativa subsp. japonica TaxID=39947 RepID=Q2R8Y2_ORYSJ|nr:Leucine Rich Repeat family protein, expressed [Oryza sativa Japonica Group]